MAVPGWNLHELNGTLAGHWSVPVNGKWRMTFRFEGENAILVDYQDYRRGKTEEHDAYAHPLIQGDHQGSSRCRSDVSHGFCQAHRRVASSSITRPQRAGLRNSGDVDPHQPSLRTATGRYLVQSADRL